MTTAEVGKIQIRPGMVGSFKGNGEPTFEQIDVISFLIVGEDRALIFDDGNREYQFDGFSVIVKGDQ